MTSAVRMPASKAQVPPANPCNVFGALTYVKPCFTWAGTTRFYLAYARWHGGDSQGA